MGSWASSLTIQTKAQIQGDSPLTINPPPAAAPQSTKAQPQDHKGQESNTAAETEGKHPEPNMFNISSPFNSDSIFKKESEYQYSKHENNISFNNEGSDTVNKITNDEKNNKSQIVKRFISASPSAPLALTFTDWQVGSFFSMLKNTSQCTHMND